MTHERREELGRLVREEWIRAAVERDDPEPSHHTPWESLDEASREIDRRIGIAVAANERRLCARQIGEACTKQLAEWDAAPDEDRPSFIPRGWWEDGMDEAAELLDRDLEAGQ
jgi:hypothetical protein